MNWIVSVTVGATDQFKPEVKQDEIFLPIPLQNREHQMAVRADVWERLRRAGLVLDETVEDLLNLALAVFIADLRSPRRQAYDAWTRGFDIYLPVLDLSTWKDATTTVETLLSFLTGDHWTLHLRKRGLVPTQERKTDASNDARQSPSIACLFSGGLDSFVGAIDLLEERLDERVALVGFRGDPSTSKPQKDALDAITHKYGDRVDYHGLWAAPPLRTTEKKESSMRGRSFLFLSLGVAVASAFSSDSPRSLYVPENGFISLNVPLTPSRGGSLSTRTTHPYLVNLYRNLLEKLRIAVKLETPYQFKTKGELLSECKNRELLRKEFGRTMSCSHPGVGRYIGRSSKDPCGYCVPCLIRQAAVKAAGFPSESHYVFDVRHQRLDPKTKRGSDLRAVQMALERFGQVPAYRLSLEVLRAGPLPDLSKIVDYAFVFRRGLTEMASFLKS